MNDRMARELEISFQKIAQALRSGMGLLQAIQTVAEKEQGPMAVSWRLVLHQVQTGESWASALSTFSQQYPGRATRLFQASVLITQETGASLGEMLEILVQDFKEGAVLQEKCRALTMQAKLSGFVLMGLPLVLILGFTCIAPELLKPLYTTGLGRGMMVYAILSLITGMRWILVLSKWTTE